MYFSFKCVQQVIIPNSFFYFSYTLCSTYTVLNSWPFKSAPRFRINAKYIDRSILIKIQTSISIHLQIYNKLNRTKRLTFHWVLTQPVFMFYLTYVRRKLIACCRAQYIFTGIQCIKWILDQYCNTGIVEREDDLTNEMKSKKAGREITPTWNYCLQPVPKPNVD